MPEPIDRAFYRDLLEEDPYLSTLGCSLEIVEPGRLEFAIPYSDRVTLAPATPGFDGVVHAGVIATAVDCGGEVIRTTADDPRAVRLATTNLHVDYLRPATSDLAVRASCVRAGADLGVADVVVESPTDAGETKQVAVGRGTYHLSPVD